MQFTIVLGNFSLTRFFPTFPWLLVKSLTFPCQIPSHFQVFQTSGHPDQRRRMGSSTALVALRNDALYKYTFTLLTHYIHILYECICWDRPTVQWQCCLTQCCKQSTADLAPPAWTSCVWLAQWSAQSAPACPPHEQSSDIIKHVTAPARQINKRRINTSFSEWRVFPHYQMHWYSTE